MLDSIIENIENVACVVTTLSEEEKEQSYRGLIDNVVSILVLTEVDTDDEEALLMFQCNEIFELLSQLFGRELWVVEDDVFVALDEVPYEDLEISQELARTNRLH